MIAPASVLDDLARRRRRREHAVPDRDLAPSTPASFIVGTSGISSERRVAA